jgi:DNA polymerase II small subunit/DNA polymerase delta subunit B
MNDLPSFDEMVLLAKENPEKLESIKQEAIKKLISQAKPETQKRLEGLQFKIDCEVKKAKNPMAAVVKLSSMMHDSFSKLRESLNSFVKKEPFIDSSIKSSSAKIINFRK